MLILPLIIRGIVVLEVLTLLLFTTKLYEPNILALKYLVYKLTTKVNNWLTFFSIKPISINAPITTTTYRPQTELFDPPSTIVTCTATCGTCSGVTLAGGTIESPNYPNEYLLVPTECIYTIEAPTGKKIQLTFTTFKVEQCRLLADDVDVCDFVSVSDGKLSDFAVKLDGYITPLAVTTTTNKMIVKFSTDSGNAGVPDAENPARWQATFDVI